MTPDDIDWPPPKCYGCGGDPDPEAPVTHECNPLGVDGRGCECLDCPWLYEEDE